MSLPYMPFYVSDYEADTAHLSAEEDGIYLRLLRLCWRTPGGTLPDDHEWIRRRIRVSREEWERSALPVIEEFFDTQPTRGRGANRIFNRRLSRELFHAQSTHEARSAAGYRGGKASAFRRKSLKTDEAEAGPAQAEPNRGSSPAEPGLKQPEPEPEPEPYMVAGGARAPARASRSALMSSVLDAAGINAEHVPVGWGAADAVRHVEGWRETGLTEARIAEAVAAEQSRRGGRPGSPRAFDQAIERAAERERRGEDPPARSRDAAFDAAFARLAPQGGSPDE